jgi:hypothetical protein
MAEDFLEYVDNLHKTYCKKNKIRNRYFLCYLPLKSITIPTNEEFYVAKGGKSRLLINHNTVWVDLTDYDMIDIICSFDDELALKTLEKLKECYDGTWTDFEFGIQGERYIGKGINYEDFNLKMDIHLDADFKICFGDFLFLLNMVLFKDIVGQKYVEREQKSLLIEKTLIKYITLIKYYKFNNSQAKKYLDSICYPIFDKEDLLKYKMKVKKYDEYFKKSDFEKIVLL